MKRNIIRISALAIILCMMAVTFMPNTVFAAGTTGKAIQLVDSYNTTGGIQKLDRICFGTQTDNYNTWTAGAVYWSVLDADKTNMNTDGMFLLSDYLIGNNPGGDYGNIRFNEESSKGNAWQGSDAQSWCSTFLSNTFSSVEQAAIMATTKSDAAYTYTDKEHYYSIGFKASKNILNGDKIFFLSVEEADNEAYGFTSNSSRVANYNNREGYWWLRSPDVFDDYYAGIVNYEGSINYGIVKDDNAARPAFNLNLSSVLFTSAVEDGKVSEGTGSDALKKVSDYTGKDWKLTLKDSSREFTASLDSQDGDKLTITYSNAKFGDNEYISAIIVNSSREITYYGNLGKASSADDSTVTVNLSGKYNDEDTLYVFNEQCNGNKMTDYSSALIDVTPHTHDYEFKGFTWTGNDEDGYTMATATYECSCGEMIWIALNEEEIVKETVEPTCEEAGCIKYTAVVSKTNSPDNEEHSETKTVTLPKKTEGCEITPEPQPDPKPVTPFPVPNTGIEAPGYDISLHYIALLGICVFVTSFFIRNTD